MAKQKLENRRGTHGKTQRIVRTGITTSPVKVQTIHAIDFMTFPSVEEGKAFEDFTWTYVVPTTGRPRR